MSVESLDSYNTRSSPDCNLSLRIELGGGFHLTIVFIIFKKIRLIPF